MDIKITDPHDAPNFDFLPHILDEFVPKNTSTKGLTGDALYQAAFSEFCNKSLSTRNNIIEAHLLISFSSNK